MKESLSSYQIEKEKRVVVGEQGPSKEVNEK